MGGEELVEGEAGAAPGNLAVVGDRIYTDMAMARGAGASGILVLSGETTEKQLESAEHRPDLVVRDVGELAELLEQARGNAT